MPKAREQYLAELRKNVSFPKTLIPGFSMTEEQMQEMLSEERLKLHEKAAKFQDVDNPEREHEKEKIAAQYGFIRGRDNTANL